MTRDDLIAFERDVADRFNRGEIRAPVHLAGGNEDALIDLFRSIGPMDWVFGTWRSHYHCLLHGVPPARLLADILAGRSIALCYPEHRILCSAIVGGHIPIALGVAWSIKRAGGADQVWVFCGDMASRTGIFRECSQYANWHDLPIRFVVEDNDLSVCTPTRETWGPDLSVETREIHYRYKLPWPHAGAGKRIQF